MNQGLPLRRYESSEQRKRKRASVRFEDYIYGNLRGRFPARLGWVIEQERTLLNRKRPDYVLYRVKYGKRERVVAEAKNVKVLTINHINQLDQYARRYHASYRLIYIPSKTYVDSSVRQHANALDIEIVRVRGFRG
jgi:negative regulator of genetic competence, sporulation and motility